MDDQEIIKFRPHHFMCTLGFRGKGYSLGFIKNYKKIVERLKQDDNRPLSKLAHVRQVQEVHGAQNRNVLDVHEDLSTGTTPQLSTGVEFQKRSIVIEVAEYMDSICGPCPNKIDEILCKTQDKILKLDKGHKEALDIKTGDRFTWQQAKTLIKQNMTVEKFHKACDGCSWKQYGVCQEELEKLIDTGEP